MNNLYDVIRRPLLTEKSTLLKETQQTLVLRGPPGRDQARDQEGGRDALRHQGRRRPRGPRARQGEAAGPLRRPAAGLEEGLRRPEEGREDGRVLRAGVEAKAMALKQYNPTSPGRRFMTTLDFSDLTAKKPERALTEPLKKTGRPQQQGPDHHLVPGRRPQARLPGDRLPARQARRPRQGGVARVRPQPLGPDRAPPLRGRREALHPRPGRAEGRADGGGGRDRGHPARQRAAPAS